jgi:hypothetical protein
VRLLLWGVRDKDGGYLEGRIPRTLHYPEPAGVREGSRLAVRLRHYELPDGVRVFRCVAIEEAPK